jgi:hypothetical protein
VNVGGDWAQIFLEALTDHPGAVVTWQTYSDRKPDPKPAGWRDPLAKILHGRLNEHVDELHRLNDLGAGIFVAVNQTDLLGRKAKNVVALRAGFADNDSGTVLGLAADASFWTRTARGDNPFWRLRPGELVTRFRELQVRIAAFYRTDPSVKDAARVMRVPGFIHRKAEPILVGFLPGSGREWTIDELLDAHPAEVVEQPTLRGSRDVDARRSATSVRVLGGREGALAEIVRQKATERPWAVGSRHNSAVETATHARKLGLGISITREIVADLLVSAGKTDSEAGEIVAWAWANVAENSDETAERPPEAVAKKRIRLGEDPALLAARLRRWYSLTADRAVEIVDEACAAELRRIGAAE